MIEVSSQTFRDRIVELRQVRASELVLNPKNWRRHPAAQKGNGLKLAHYPQKARLPGFSAGSDTPTR